MSKLPVPRIAILASGSGSTAEAYAHAIYDRKVAAKLCVVISSKADAYILKRVERWNQEWSFGTKTAVINQHTHPAGKQPRGQTTEESEAICALLASNHIDIVVYLGYMRIASGRLIQEYGFVPGTHTSKYQARSLNSHPGPLPLTADTYGLGASAKVLEAYNAGHVQESRHTVHVVAQGVDQGPIVAEYSVPIEPRDSPETLFARVQLIEKANIAQSVDKFWRDQQAYLLEA